MANTRLHVDIQADYIDFSDYADISAGVKELLDDVELVVTGNDRASAHWQYVSDPSLYLDITPNGVSSDQIEQIASETWEALHQASIALEADRWAGLELTAKRRNALDKLVKHIDDELQSITIVVQGHEPITLHNVPDFQQQTSTKYEDVSSIDGTVELITLNPRRYFAVREHTEGTFVKVYFGEEWVETVRQSWGRFVEVTGLVRYREDGTVISIRDLVEIRPYPGKDVNIDDLAGKIPDLLGDRTLGEYMDEIRGRVGS